MQQYGRHFYRWVDQLAKEKGLDREFVMLGLMNRFRARLKDEDMSWYLEGLTDEEALADLKELDDCKDEIARSQEKGWWPGL